jgi:hypothetical protein
MSTVILLNGEGVVAWLGDHLGLSSMTKLVWTVLQFPLAIGALVAVLWLVYYFLPNCRRQDKKILIFGATLSTLLWIAATLLFRLYVQKFNALNPAYGAIGAIMVLLSWMYYSSFVLLAVGELMAKLQAGTGRADKRVEETPLSGAGVPRSHALVLRRGDGRRLAGDGREGRLWAALDRITPVHPVRRVHHAATSVQGWLDGTLDHLRADVAVAVREIGALLRAVGAGSLLCAVGATLAFLGGLSLVTGAILVIGDQWLPRDWYALAALLVALAAAVATWRLARRALSLLASVFQRVS